MIKFIVGIVVGIIIATTGISGLVKILDHGVDTTKSFVKEKVEESEKI